MKRGLAVWVLAGLAAAGALGDLDTEAAVARKCEVVCYEARIQNRTDQPIENLKLEYQYCVLEKDYQPDTETRKPVRPEREVVIRTIAAKSSVALTIKEITIARKYQRVNIARACPQRSLGYDLQELSEEKLDGLWIRVCGPSAGGEPTSRDVIDPDGLQKSFSWGRK